MTGRLPITGGRRPSLRLAEPFADRADAGRRLAARLEHLRDQPTVVLGLPRGGVPVAAEVARALHAPLDVIGVRKLGVPFQPELAMGAVGEGGTVVLNAEIVRMAGVSDRQLAAVEQREREVLARRLQRYRGARQQVPLRGRVAVVVDDGIATGSTARAACRIARRAGAARVVLAVPVAPSGWEDNIGADADECVALATPEPFLAIGRFYRDFSPTSDDEVVACLGGTAAGPRDAEVEVAAGPLALPGQLAVPSKARGIVVFAHGSGSSRHSPRNRHVAGLLGQAGLATLLFDLLTPEEEMVRSNVFDVALLARRLVQATDWVRRQADLAQLPLGYFGASTGAAAALRAAAAMAGRGTTVAAVVSRGGRPDLAGDALGRVEAPTLLIVGGADTVVLELNRAAHAELRCEARLAVVPGATHLFEEPGTLDQAAAMARDWFVAHMAGPEDRRPSAP